MGAGISVLLLAAGAILAFAVSIDPTPIAGLTVEWDTVGVVLMVAGAIGLVWSLLTLAAWRDRGTTTVVERPDERVLRSELLHPRGQIGGAFEMEPVGDRGVVHLRAREVRPAELLGRPHPLDEVLGDRVAGGVGGERTQHRRVPRPFLEHLRRRLHEVPLGRHPGEAHPVVPASEHVVHLSKSHGPMD